MGQFVSKPAFDLTKFLSEKGKSPSMRRRPFARKAFTAPTAAPEATADTVTDVTTPAPSDV